MLKKFYQYEVLEAGCDEAGRGCLAGPVFAASVMLDKTKRISGLDDSKKLSEKKRLLLRDEIENKALTWAVAQIDVNELDKINILNASIKAMQTAAGKLSTTPQLLLIDGNRFKPYKNIPYRCVVDGDALYQSIAAASILAKTYRDAYMLRLHEQFPQYAWHKNKGYGTVDHRKAIARFGTTEHHRKSFSMGIEQLELF
ncbi:MAG TPA: ribonuclease HII [Bacteroidia bacterium]|nr:ribonuclease HII [Bacteroidia bacterium]